MDIHAVNKLHLILLQSVPYLLYGGNATAFPLHLLLCTRKVFRGRAYGPSATDAP